MKKDSVVRARIDSELKEQAVSVLSACGLELSDAIRLFLRQVVAREGIPFMIGGSQADPSAARLAELKRESQARDRRIAASQDVSGGEMFLIRPDDARRAKVRWPRGSLL
ncbi:MAG: type II toxin-antitoxin system RelB/DinJ family antitoxin [Proteobacteria bacterium]|nr:type II toxin-antitoxin system RelB/DinJ family antitoxin [Pseudomonadota bacterium]